MEALAFALLKPRMAATFERLRANVNGQAVMPGLVPGIHVLLP